jgi:hypothetical protein
MRLYITNDKENLIKFLKTYLQDLLKHKKVELIVNGSKQVGTIENVELEENEDYILIHINNKITQIPLLEETKARFGKELVIIETKNHTTVIEIEN